MKKILISLLLLAFAGEISAQSAAPFVIGEVAHLRSSILKEDRTLNIYLPENYRKDSTTNFPVIYLLDGSAQEDFVHIAGLVQFLTMIQAMPPSIVVGIGNVDRKRDFTFPSTLAADQKILPTAGGSAAFISFIAKELQPYVQQHYRTNGEKTLIGQSLGGLLATEVLLKQPALFRDYIIISPSLWWSGEALLGEAPVLLKTHTPDNIRVYVAVGTEGKQMEADAACLATMLKDAGWKTTFTPLPEESHLTILHNCAYKALTFLHQKSH